MDTAESPQHLLAVPRGREASLDAWTAIAESACPVDPGLYVEYDVKRGLRDQTGKGVLAGLTRIGDVVGTAAEGDQLVPAPGQLLYRGIEITDLVNGFVAEGQPGFEETAYLLLFGELPTRPELEEFDDVPVGHAQDAPLVHPRRDPPHAEPRHDERHDAGRAGPLHARPAVRRHLDPQRAAPEPAPDREVPDARRLRLSGLPRRVPRQEPRHPSARAPSTRPPRTSSTCCAPTAASPSSRRWCST